MNSHSLSSYFPNALQGRRMANGFTLVELIVSVAIVAVITVIALPSFKSLVANQRINVTSSDLLSSLIKARSEAIKRNGDVTITPTTGSQWEGGWTIVDSSATPVTLETHAAITGATITGPANVVYQATGRIRNTTSPSFNIDATSATRQRCVTVDLSGLPSRKQTSC